MFAATVLPQWYTALRTACMNWPLLMIAVCIPIYHVPQAHLQMQALHSHTCVATEFPASCIVGPTDISTSWRYSQHDFGLTDVRFLVQSGHAPCAHMSAIGPTRT